ncbi:MAG TPA: NADH-quinone oxidoreductase subunit C [Gemmataceae bacterium]|jgi:NADH-quinone oxidoreductase subunit C|nr:NADH-quinone oxidoreductase subunit C [Gemmataceae bacterium]
MMTSAEIIAALEQQFPGKIKAKQAEAIDPFVVVEPADLMEVCRFLRDDPQLRFEVLNCISGVDYLETDPKKTAKAGFEPHMEVVYHLSSFTHRHRFVLKIALPRWKDSKTGELPEVPSVTPLWLTADWHEREVYDLSGVWFTGHPNLRRILTSEDWVGHPLRKDYEFPLEYHGIRGR